MFTQGISPFEDRAGAAELQTSKLPKSGCSCRSRMSEKGERGARTVNARITRIMTDTHFI